MSPRWMPPGRSSRQGGSRCSSKHAGWPLPYHPNLGMPLSLGGPPLSILADVMTPQQERAAAMAAYTAARIDFEAAQEQWDAYLAVTDKIEGDSTEAGAAFERLRMANEVRQDAVDSLWLAWRNRPTADGPS